MSQTRFTAFDGMRRLAGGDAWQVAQAVRQAGASRPIAVFDDLTGKPVDLDLTAGPPPAANAEPRPARGRGRPRLGVTAREVTLLPRHWDWLNAQPGGASVTLRKLVEAARRSPEAATRQSQAAAYAFMSAMAGDFPGFEQATRALFAGDRPALEALIAPWPADVRNYALALAFLPVDV
jgi:hypothetical protein